MEDELGMSEKQEGFITTAEKAYRIISKNIFNGELEPGCKLSRRKMAELAGVSVIPVIEALKRLEDDGLVESKPKWGSFVIFPTIEKIRDMYVLREALECQVARVLSQKITGEQAQELRRIAYELDNPEYTNEILEYITSMHYEFHSKMADYTGYASLINSIHKINLFWILCNAIKIRRAKSPIPKDFHTSLVDVIALGDPDKAEAKMRAHVYDSLRAIEAKFGVE
jgi:DNA-binding GntR family transcriptional regulator